MPTMCERLHVLFNKMQRFSANSIDDIPFTRGIYIFFGEGETYKNEDRIIRVGTHGTSKDNDLLKQRLKNHFLKLNKDGSIFRKNVGKALIKKNDCGDDIYDYWCIDFSKKENSFLKETPLWNKKMEMEEEVSRYLASNMSFSVIPFDSYVDRDRFETGIISALCQDSQFKPSNPDWLGNFVPEARKTRIKTNRMWVSDKADSSPLTEEEFTRLEAICKRYFVK